MDMYQIDVDAQVHAALRELGRTGDTFNGVLRSLLGLPGQKLAGRSRHRLSRHGLGPLLDAGLQPGQRLIWDRPRLHEQHTVTVDADGNLITEAGTVCATPNVATRALSGYPAAGWPAFCTDEGVSLEMLRSQLASSQTGNARQNRASEG
jgi:hypothetical protein